ncbi:hypothetical protein BC792_102250 [Sphingobacterium allocomposti]|jgi:hypothetical protein|uniref:Uncharacterized protein n=1 Tax=Sphingobacterium allocomposti TaxID=415956 RepID=A0A5S5DPJ2_9SPHI|nr:hypothetical protein [Sphingobacterium composti Yoo et al. 2007 non Ten et al. 2007]TYP97827.1 hypothetical protein BC792_102250 [Sphingobacterium composti Yoo et al. 2007 non Ten et al. 2007]HLS96389.1 hypothetical protein [Sphingobacterium sp.]
MTAQQREMIVGDFERYMRYIQSQNRAFTLADFVTFATSLINFYSGSQLIDTAERKDTALILSSSFNKGLGNRITEDDIGQISELIISDPTLDYSILSPIFA